MSPLENQSFQTEIMRLLDQEKKKKKESPAPWKFLVGHLGNWLNSYLACRSFRINFQIWQGLEWQSFLSEDKHGILGLELVILGHDPPIQIIDLAGPPWIKQVNKKNPKLDILTIFFNVNYGWLMSSIYFHAMIYERVKIIGNKWLWFKTMGPHNAKGTIFIL